MKTKKFVLAVFVLLQMAVPSHAQKVLNVYSGGKIFRSVNAVDIDSIVIRDKVKAENVETFDVNGVTFNMVKVEGGTFLMGDTSLTMFYEEPIHEVTLSDYYIGETEVTQALWQAVMGSNPSEFKGNDLLPVECVSWDDCQEFIAKLNTLTGRQFRLPTEAQWEYAARGGNRSEGYIFSGRDNLDDVGWYCDNADLFVDDRGLRQVATKAPNELGLYDMSGNVYEWCQDWLYEDGEYARTDPTDPWGPGTWRVIRGGCWGSDSIHCRVSVRRGYPPQYEYVGSGIGFRLAL